MSLCINPICLQPHHPENANNRWCQSCGSDLLVNSRYRVMRLLSNHTGFGIIYEAYEQNIPKILKVLKENLNRDSTAVELFKQEAAVLGQLEHSGIPKVDGYFQYVTKNELTLHCLVMEKIDGVNLEQWLKQQGNDPITEQQAITWLKQLAEILHLVHGKQLFHRDIKPANIMLRRDGRLVLIDFGTAREATYSYLAKVGAGHEITAVVSAGYTPPEQANYQAMPQSDFFALGRTFVYLLTGQHPLKFYDVLNDVFNWREAANSSPKLADFLDRLMERKPGDRPLNTQILLQQLDELEKKLAKPTKKLLPVKAVAAGVTLLALGGGFGYLASKLGQPPLANTQEPTISASSPITPNPATTANPLETLSVTNTLTGHSKAVSAIAIDPIGQLLTSGSGDSTIKIWNLADGNLIRTLTGHTKAVTSVAISPDGQNLVSGSADNTIKIWNLADGKLIRTLTGHSDLVTSVAISPDGQTLVSGSADKTVKIWNLPDGKLIRVLMAHSDWVNSVAIGPDGQTLASGSADKTIRIWNLTNGKLIRILTGHSDWVNSVAISLDGQTLVSGSADKTVKIWNLVAGNLVGTLTGHSDWVGDVSISPDGQTLVSGSADKTVKIWSLVGGNLIDTLSAHSDSIGPVVISPDGETLVSGSKDKTIKIWHKSR